MTKKIRRYTPEFKSRVALEAIKGDKTLAEIASEYEITVKNIQNWKKIFLENSETVFKQAQREKQHKEELKEKEKMIDELYKEVGNLTVQVNWAKKKIRESGLE
jgi:putative transposase